MSPLHAVPSTHDVPADEQVCGVVPLHRLVPGLQVTHDPLRQTGVVPLQGFPDCQTPVDEQVCGVVPLHCLAPGTHA